MGKRSLFFADKDRYERELRRLGEHNSDLKRPKKCLSAYMIFVKEVSRFSGSPLSEDKALDRGGQPNDARARCHERSRQRLEEIE